MNTLNQTLNIFIPLHARAVATLGFAAAAFALAPIAHASCGAAFCSANTEWTSGAHEPDSAVLEIRYEQIRQNQPRSGSTKVDIGQIRRHHDEVETTNRNVLFNYNRTFASGWGYSVSVPVVMRDHLHIHHHHGASLREAWDFRELGDIRIGGRYQFPVGEQDTGAQIAGLSAGVKLPTGRTGVANADGNAAERSLQPGSGTTDLVLGAFFQKQLPGYAASVFMQAQYQRAAGGRTDYAPGAQTTLDLGISRRLGERLTGMLQLNAVSKRADRGPEAEPADTGGRALYLSPGVAYNVGDGTQLYAIWQQPVYQHVRGVQITPRHALTIGLTKRL